MSLIRLLLATAICITCLIASAAALPKIEAKCTACRSIARELTQRIKDEKPRNALDMRHRLDGTGQRYGRVINYKESELRATELLDNLCSSTSDYTLVKTNVSAVRVRHWAKVKGKGPDDLVNTTRLPGEEEKAMTKKLEVYCGSLLEEYEDDVTEAIMKLKLEEEGSVSDYVCTELTKACPAANRGANDVIEEVQRLQDVKAAAEAAAVGAAAPEKIEGEAAEDAED
eukprot:gene15573-21671_t